jgi:23S rRNA (cytidine1920-2'-O)/16S rRNA (cytidine1409-2'-O)-methyltransferase
MKSKTRLDEALVKAGLVRSKSQAHDIIKRGLVKLPSGQLAKKAGESIDPDLVGQIIIEPFNTVSRAGDKLLNAILALNLDVRGVKALDLGQSTGGFTQVLLERGAKQVVGVDVGSEQLDQSLKLLAKENPNLLIYFENLNCKDLNKSSEFLAAAKDGFDLIVADISFISLRKALEVPVSFCKSTGQLLLLFKPQFELEAKALNKSGVVRHIKDVDNAKSDFKSYMHSVGFNCVSETAAELKGKHGNQEYFILFKKIS